MEKVGHFGIKIDLMSCVLPHMVGYLFFQLKMISLDRSIFV